MELHLADSIAGWLDGPRGVNHHLGLIVIADGDAPPPSVRVVSAERDPEILAGSVPAGPYPVVSVGVPGGMSWDPDGPGGRIPVRQAKGVEAVVVAYLDETDPVLCNVAARYIGHAIRRSLEELDTPRDFDPRPWTVRNGLRIEARTAMTSDVFRGGVKGVTGGAIVTAQYTVRDTTGAGPQSGAQIP